MSARDRYREQMAAERIEREGRRHIWEPQPLAPIERIAADVRTIRTVLVWWVVLSGIALVLLLLSS